MDNKKIAIIGVGNVGSTLAYTLASKNICSHIVLKDIKQNLVKAMALDISQAANAAKSSTRVTHAENGEDLEGCSLIVITAGLPRMPGMSRNDLLITNAKILKTVLNEIKEVAPKAIIIVVSNPLFDFKNQSIQNDKYKRNNAGNQHIQQYIENTAEFEELNKLNQKLMKENTGKDKQ